MNTRLQDRIGAVQGHVQLWDVNALGVWTPRTRKQNLIQYSWGHIAAMAMGRGLSSYKIRAMYIEYANVTAPEDLVIVPEYGRDAGLEYYNDLAFATEQDFLRVPMIQDPMLSIEEGFEDYFTEGLTGNKLTFFALTQGIIGIHGNPYSADANSKVFGAALVATPTFSDRTKDIIFARTYFDLAEQVVKEASHQIGITWDVAFL